MKKPARQSTISSAVPDGYSEAGLHRALGLTNPDEPARLAISKIRRDGGTQPRAELDPATVQEYAEDMARGDTFPPGIVFHDGTDYWLARGFTRTAAAESLGWTEFDYIVKQGTQRDAVLFSVGENADHGLRRTNEDKRRAVLVLLQDVEWSQLSSEVIAGHCRVSHTFVNNIRRSLATVASQGEQGEKTPQTRIGNDGREYNIDRIQKKAQKRAAKKSPSPASEPVRNLDESEPVGDWQDRPAQPRGLYRVAGAASPGPGPRAAVDGVPTEQDNKQWIVGQLRKLAGMVREYNEPGSAQTIVGEASVLAGKWRTDR